jgi:hypothetical protein
MSNNINRDMDKLIQCNEMSGKMKMLADVIYHYLDISKYNGRIYVCMYVCMYLNYDILRLTIRDDSELASDTL